jgi:hypothetical protein
VCLCAPSHCTWIFSEVTGGAGECVERNTTTHTCSSIVRYGQCSLGGGIHALSGLCEYYDGLCVYECPWYKVNSTCTSASGGRCFWLLENGGSGSCVIMNNLECSDLLVEDQCDGVNVPSPLANDCFLLRGNDSEISSQKGNKCMKKVWAKSRGENK